MKPTPIQSSETYDPSGSSDVAVTAQRSRLKGLFYSPTNTAGATRIINLKDSWRTFGLEKLKVMLIRSLVE